MSKIKEFIKTGENPDGKIARNCVSICITREEEAEAFVDKEALSTYMSNDWFDITSLNSTTEYRYYCDTGLIFDSEIDMKAEEKLLEILLQDYLEGNPKVEVSMYNDMES